MIALYTFGPFLGTPDSSPFVIKAMLLLRLAGLEYREVRGNPFLAPKRLLPYIRDGRDRVHDSTLIRLHIERKYGFDFDAALTLEQKAVAWAVEKMCEDHLYFAMLRGRWLDKRAFDSGLGRHMFNAIPPPLRPLAKSTLRRMNARRLLGHGLGRHGEADIEAFAARDIAALAAILGQQSYLMGEALCAADASVFGIVTAILTPPLDLPIRAAMASHANLVAYRDRIIGAFFPQFLPA